VCCTVERVTGQYHMSSINELRPSSIACFRPSQACTPRTTRAIFRTCFAITVAIPAQDFASAILFLAKDITLNKECEGVE
jgi:hypothetical protein